NTDLLRAGLNTSSAVQHYLSFGYREQRSTSFDSSSYLAANTDLLRAGLNTSSAVQHYISFGYQEQRSTSFDAASYMAANTDLNFSSASLAVQHYVSFGYREQRSTSFDFSTVDIASYFAFYTDLQSALGGGTDRYHTALDHYRNYGIFEGRRIVPIQPASTATGIPTLSTTGTPLTAALSVVGETDMYAVTLQRGVLYTLRETGASTSTGTLNDPYLRLFDSNRNLVAQDDDGGVGRDALIQYRPTQTGTYYVSAGSFGSSGTGTYQVSASQPSQTEVFPPVSDTLSFPYERDSFNVALTQGTRYQIDLEGAATNRGTLTDPYLRILDSHGLQLRYDDDSGVGLNSELTFTPTTSGTYTLQVASAGSGYGYGSYTLSVTQLG
ncbi:pre-peptidase C-terminal domain-containing protein, partial [Azospirillum sp. TSO35-2]|uniref:pre-peptidase C-terminal domain-containing protein n=1 Tax=Azospirillum sp. TSO35-2 TaxID=716796 RepID=UPI000D613E31